MKKTFFLEKTDSDFLSYVIDHEGNKVKVSLVQKHYVKKKLNAKEITKKTGLSMSIANRVIDELIRRRLLTI